MLKPGLKILNKNALYTSENHSWKKGIGLIPFLLTQGKSVKCLHVNFETIRAHKVSPQLKKDHEYAPWCFKDPFLTEEVINLCFRETVTTPLILQQNLYLCLTSLKIWTWWAYMQNSHSLLKIFCSLPKAR